MAQVKFVFDPMFDDNLLHWRSTLNPVGDVFRRTADKLAAKARRIAREEAARAVGATNSLVAGRYRASQKQGYLRAKALAYSMKRYAELIYAIEVHGGRENYSAVCAGHAAGVEIEFGGTDRIIKAGTSPLDYPAMMILRRAIR